MPNFTTSILIFLQETLKAVKSQELKKSQEAKAKQQQQQQEPTSNANATTSDNPVNRTKPTIHSHRRTASSGQAHELLQQGATDDAPDKPRLAGNPVQRRVSMKDEKLRAAIERIRDSRGGAEGSVATAAEAPDAYSPKLGAKQSVADPTKQRKIKLGTKAADLFNKLQLRLSTGNKLS